MIIFYHNNSIVTEVVSTDVILNLDVNKKHIVKMLLQVSTEYQDEILIWCDENERDNLNINAIDRIFHHKKVMVSYNPNRDVYFDSRIGYLEDTLFIKVNKSVKYPTWQMSSKVGAIHSSVINACKGDLCFDKNFDYFLNSFAKRAMPLGLLCYSEPKLLKKTNNRPTNSVPSLYKLFRFTKQHYKTRWVFLLFINLIIFEKKISIIPFISAFFYRERKLNSHRLNQIEIVSNRKNIEKGTIDVLIPTIGRKDYLLSVLENLESQTYQPTNVIIIEQNPDMKSFSELDYIQNGNWSFNIKHHFTHKTGACNARNIGLDMIESEFVFMADDDIVFENNLLEKAIQIFATTGTDVFQIACLLTSQKLIYKSPFQFSYFGAGHAFVRTSCLENLRFDVAYEYGFGEDNDFGMQIRNKGYDILFYSVSKIIHLKAPVGGLRTKPVLRWSHEDIQPKPSPTVMFFCLKYFSIEQLNCYKFILFTKNVKGKSIFHIIKHIVEFNKKWNKSMFWAKELIKS